MDTAGQDEYSVIPQSYFININGYVLVYSVNSQKRYLFISDFFEKHFEMDFVNVLFCFVHVFVSCI